MARALTSGHHPTCSQIPPPISHQEWAVKRRFDARLSVSGRHPMPGPRGLAHGSALRRIAQHLGVLGAGAVQAGILLPEGDRGQPVAGGCAAGASSGGDGGGRCYPGGDAVVPDNSAD